MAGIFLPLDVMQDYENIDFIKVGSDTLQNGYLVIADTLAGTYVSGLGSVYTPVKNSAITDANLAVVCAEEYYQDANGNRIDITDPTLLTFTTGQIVRILRPALNKKYLVSNDLITGVPAAGKYLVPTAGAYGWTVADDFSSGNAGIKTALKIEEINNKQIFVGLGAITGVKVRCVRAAGE